jgi:hypothetical protein
VPIDEVDVDMGSDAYILAPELAKALKPSPQPTDSADGSVTIGAPAAAAAASAPSPTVRAEGTPTHAAIRTTAGSAEQFFRLMPGLQNLADRSKRIVVRLDVDANAADTYDRAWFRNAVEEHLEEAGVENEVDLT